MVRLQIVGGGRMGEALLAGLLRSGVALSDVAVVEAVATRRAELESAHRGLSVLDAPVACEGAVVAVKPGDVDAVVARIAGTGCTRLLSIAAGVTLARLEAAAGPGIAVLRAMPNTPALIGAGAAAVAGGTSASAEDLRWAEQLLEAVGTVVRVPESQLDAVTGLSGSGPAYVFLMAEALIDAGVLVGLPRPVATELATATLAGAARLLVETGDDPSALRAAVTSPGGTTAAGLHQLELHRMRAALADAVVAATARSRELS